MRQASLTQIARRLFFLNAAIWFGFGLGRSPRRYFLPALALLQGERWSTRPAG